MTIDLNQIAQKYQDEDEVSLKSLCSKRMIDKDVTYLIVDSSDALHHKFKIIAHEIDYTAAKMIVLTGGTVTQIVDSLSESI